MTDPLDVADDLDTQVNAHDLPAGEPEAGFAPGHRADIRIAVRNGDFSEPPPDPTLPIDNLTNKLPGWSLVNVQGTSIQYYWVPSSGGSGGALRRTVTDAAVGDEAYLESQPIKATASADQQFLHVPSMYVGAATSSQNHLQDYLQGFYLDETGTLTGTSSSVVALWTMTPLSTSLPDVNGGVEPADASAFVVRQGVRVIVGSTVGAASRDVAYVADVRARGKLWIVDRNTPTNGPGYLEKNNNVVWLTPAGDEPLNPTPSLKVTRAALSANESVVAVLANGDAYLGVTGGHFRLSELGTDPATPPANVVGLYPLSDHHVYLRDSMGTIRRIDYVIGTDVEAHDADLTDIAALTPANDDVLQRKASHWANRTIAQLLVDLAAPGTTFQPLDSDLTAIAALATTAIGRSLLAGADAAALRAILALGTVATLASDTDTLLVANSDARVATQKAVKAYVDAAVVGLLDFKGNTDASANPNYPAASKGDAYAVSVAGKVGGASGKSVDIGDVYVASADNAGGTEASVGTSWFVLEHNLTGALLAANNLSDLASAATARTNLGLGTGDSPQFTAINVGHASDTTLTRTGAGDIAVEGNAVYRAGGTDVPLTDGGTGASTAAAARTNLGLAIGTDVQAYDAELAALAALVSAADALPYFTGSGTAALSTLTSYMRTLIDDATQAAAMATLSAAGVVTGLPALATGSLTVSTDDNAGSVVVLGKHHDTGTGSSQTVKRKSRGTAAAPTIIGAGDAISADNTYAYDGTTYLSVAQWLIVNDGSAAAGALPTRHVWTVARASGAASEAMRLDSGGNLGIGKTAAAGVRLDVSGAAAVSGKLTATGGTAGGGTSFPVSPTTGDRYFRTDRNIEYVYDGTRWLSTTLYSDGLQTVGDIGHLTATATQGRAAVAFPGLYDLWLVSADLAFLVEAGGTALDASNKWVVDLYKQPAAALLASWTINSGTNSYRNGAAVAIGALLGTTNFVFQTFATKTGTPGALSAMTRINYRLVG